MKRFKFKLQTLLNIREAREREIEYELAKIISLQNLERAKQERLLQKIEEQKVLFGDKLKRGYYSINEVVLFERFVDVSLRAIEPAENKIKSMQPQINEVRERLI